MKRPTLVVAGGTAVVTGAAGGMGEHIARGLARRGAHLAILDRDRDGLDRVVGEIGREDPDVQVSSYVVDLSVREEADAAIARVRDAHPDIRMLFNNAGVALGGRFTEVSAEDFDWLLEVNLLAPIRLTRALLPLMLENGQGQVVNISSLFGLVGPPGQSAYSTSKFGLRGFSESLRSELESEKLPVGLTVVHPGGIKTNIAVNARVGGNVSAEEAAREQKSFAKMLSYPADRAAEEIIKAAISRQSRLVIGRDAMALDVLARLAPAWYGTPMRVLMSAVAK